MDCSIGFLLPANFFFPPFFSSRRFPFLRPRRGRTPNNRWWNDRRSCNLRISWCSLPIVPVGGEPHPLFLLFAPFGDGSGCGFLLSAGSIPFGHSTRGY